MAEIFEYGDTEIIYLKNADTILGAAIEQIGPIERPVTRELFSSLVSSIVAQQISAKAADTVWSRMEERLGEITPATINAADTEDIRRCGMSMRKAAYIKEAAAKVISGEFNIDSLNSMSDDDVRKKLSELKGIGAWTAEMLMIFSMQRPDIISWDDLAIHRGLRMLYKHRKITKELFQKYRHRYSPYATVASLYLWAIASGKYGYKDYAPMTDAQKKKNRKKKPGTVQKKTP